MERLYEQELKPIMGPLIGHSSDGDSRRRKIILQLATVTAGSRFQPIPRNEGFVFSCRKEGRGNDYVIHDMCDQDFIHNHKKLLNPLDHANRVLMMGNFLVHMNHIQLVYESCPVLDHGLGLGDIDRRDRQNWRSAQKLTFPKVWQCIQTLIDGALPGTFPNAALLGMQTYLQVVWYYVEIFCSEEASLSTRIKYAAIVTHFLAIWCTAMITYVGNKFHYQRDVLLSCHFAVMLICYMRDNFPQQECRLDLSGSDLAEEFWSKNGQWVGNHHNYNYADLRRNSTYMIRLEEIRVDSSATEFVKPHPKQESIWPQQYNQPLNRSDLTAYPECGKELEWKEGIEIARRLARLVGMAQEDDGNDHGDEDGSNGRNGGDTDNWFWCPFDFPGNTFTDDNSSLPTSSDEEETSLLGPDISGR